MLGDGVGAESRNKRRKKKGDVMLQNPAQNCPVSEIFFHSLITVNCVTFPQVVSTAQSCISGSLYLVLYFSQLSVHLSS